MKLVPTAPQRGILLVDDEVMVLKTLVRLLRSEPFTVFTAASADAALDVLARESIQVVVSDQHMPGKTGVDLLKCVRELYPDVVRIMLTGYTEMNIAVDAINEGQVHRLMTKPWNDQDMRATVRHALDTWEMRREIERLNQVTQEQNAILEDLNRSLEVTVQDRTKELAKKHQELRHAYISTVAALAEAVDAKDAYTRGHSERVGIYAARIARQLGCKGPFIEQIYLGGLLHDIGKIGVPDEIIRKPGRLTAEEYGIMKQHPEIGARILEPVSFLADVVPCVRHHHEWYDGSSAGYPDRLSGQGDPLPEPHHPGRRHGRGDDVGPPLPQGAADRRGRGRDPALSGSAVRPRRGDRLPDPAGARGRRLHREGVQVRHRALLEGALASP